MSNFNEMNGKMKFLIVDDVSVHVETNKSSLRRMGYSNFLSEENAYDAFRFLKKHHVDFIVSRLVLPGVSGVDMVSELKADLLLQRTPITIFSDALEPPEVTALLDLGVDAHLKLPIAQKNLAENLAAAWSRFIDPNHIETHLETGRRLFVENRLPDAEKVYKALLTTGKVKSRVLYGLAHVSRKAGDLKQAKALCEQILAEFPKDVYAYQLLGEIFLDEKNVEGAKRHFAKALEVAPKNPFRYEAIGQAYSTRQMHRDAEAIYRQGIDLKLQYQGILDGLASSLVSLNEKAEAIRFFERLVNLFPKEVKYLNNIAVCYKNLGALDNAVEYYKRAIEVEPKNSKVIFNLALLYVEKNQLNAARSNFIKALELEPTNERIKQKLDQVEIALGKKTAPKQDADPAAKASEAPSTPKTEDPPVPATEVTPPPPPKPTTIQFAAAEMQKLDSLFASVKQLNYPPHKAAVASFKLDPEMKKKIEHMDDIQLKYQYYSALKQLRVRFQAILKEYFKDTFGLKEKYEDEIWAGCVQYLRLQKFDAQIIESMQKTFGENRSLGWTKISDLSTSEASLKKGLSDFLIQKKHIETPFLTLSGLIAAFEKVTEMPDVGLWTAVESLMLNIEEKELVRDIYKTFAGKIPDRPGPEILEAKGDLPRRLANLETDFVNWRIMNQLMKRLTQRIFSYVDDGIPNILKSTETLLTPIVTAVDVRKKIIAISQASLAAHNPSLLSEVTKLSGQDADELAPMFRAALTAPLALSTLHRRVTTFMEIASIFINVHLEVITPPVVKEKFYLYGPSLSYTWAHCMARCRAAEDKETIKKIISQPASATSEAPVKSAS